MVKKFSNRFSRLDTIPACDGQTDVQTDTLRRTAKTALCRASRGSGAWIIGDWRRVLTP